MTTPRQLQDGFSLVVLGAFNPTIFQPSWFAQEDLLQQEEADRATIEIIHREVTAFKLDWLKLQITRDLLILHSNRESHYETTRDLLIGTLTLLRHTPTQALGVNHDWILECKSQDSFNQLGWSLVPKDNWCPVLQRPGMIRVEEQGERTDNHSGHMRVRIEPFLDGGTKIICAINDHFSVSQENNPNSTMAISELLNAEWNHISERASQIHDHVKGLIK